VLLPVVALMHEKAHTAEDGSLLPSAYSSMYFIYKIIRKVFTFNYFIRYWEKTLVGIFPASQLALFGRHRHTSG
jgi:hypothetical protein